MVDGLVTSAKEDRARGVAYDASWYNRDYFRLHLDRRQWYYPNAWTLARHLEPRRALDVGCGVGFMVEAWALEGIDARGIDVSQDALDLARPDIKERLQRVNAVEEPIPFPDGHFDLATCIEVIEHLPSHDRLLKEVFRVLRPGGHWYVQTPRPNTPEADDPTHIAVLPKKEWIAMHEKAGFELADDELLRWEHELPMTPLGRNLGWLRTTGPMKRYVVRTGTRTLYRKPE